MQSIQLTLSIFRRTTLRHWRSHWGQYLLLILIVAIGVGAFNGIRQASRAACENFGLFNQAVSGRSDFIIEPVSGNMDSRMLKAIRPLTSNPDWHLVPIMEGTGVTLGEADQPEFQVRLLGIDPISLMNLPGQVGQADFSTIGSSWQKSLSEDPHVWIGPAAAEKMSLSEGVQLSLLSGGQKRPAKIRKILDDPNNQIPDNLMIGDIPAIGKLLGRPGEVNRIEVVIEQQDRRDQKAYLEQLEMQLREGLPPSMKVSPTPNRASERAAMTSAFRLNLSILSLIAILVGAYLILQALDASVIRRRSEIAILRSMGVSQGIMFAGLLLEALVIGLLGSALGIGVGYLLALGAVGMIADTVNAIYFSTAVEAMSLTITDVVSALVLGTVFSLLAGWLPARDAMQTPPAQILTREDWSPGFVWLRKPHTGLLLITLGALALLFPPLLIEGGSKVPAGGFMAAGAWIMGTALLSGQVLVWISGLVQKWFSTPIPRLALSRLKDGSSRHRLAVAGLVIAVGMVTGMLQMTNSFRDTIRSWFDIRFQADLYISERVISGSASASNGIAPEVLETLLTHESIEYADPYFKTQVQAEGSVTYLAGADIQSWTERIDQIWLKEPGTLQVAPNSELALVSEAFARRFDVLDGGSVSLQTLNGIKRVSPVGIYADYGNEFGTAAIDLEKWKAWTGSQRATNVSLFLKDDISTNAVRDQLRLAYPGLVVRNQNELKEVVLGIFNQTFSSTVALNLIGLVVALLGLSLGLFAIFDESSRTWEILKQLGLSKLQLVLIAGIEGSGISLAAWLCGSLLGIAVGVLLIYVINVQSFGWTLLWSPQTAHILSFGVLLIVAGFLSGCTSAAFWHSKKR